MKDKISKKFILLILLSLLTRVFGDEIDHTYEDGDELILWVDSVHPYFNPQETYSYCSLPFCNQQNDQLRKKYHRTIGDWLTGAELVNTQLDIRFKKSINRTKICTIEMTPKNYESFKMAIKQHYLYEMRIDELPIRGYVGKYDPNFNDGFIFTHQIFQIKYNETNVVDVRFTNAMEIYLEMNVNITFTYEVHWIPSEVRFEDRFDQKQNIGGLRYFFNLNQSAFQIRSFAVINTLIMIFFMAFLIFLVLKKAFKSEAEIKKAKLSQNCFIRIFQKLNRKWDADYIKWRKLYQDVFRPVSHPLLFSTLIGSGCHVTSVICITIGIASIGEMYNWKFSLLSAFIFIYIGTASINGFVGGRLYLHSNGKRWMKQTVVAGLFGPSVIFGFVLFIDTIAEFQHNSKAVSPLTMMALACVCIVSFLLLTLIGTLLGRKLSSQTRDYPFKVSDEAREIPVKKWYAKRGPMIILCGVVPFGSIHIELIFMMKSWWSYTTYGAYDFLLISFVMMIITTSFMSVFVTFALLYTEDHRWQWTSMLGGMSSSGYVFIYAVHYFIKQTKMQGLFQIAFYFGCMGLLSISVGLMCGATGFLASDVFVWRLYSTLKDEKKNLLTTEIDEFQNENEKSKTNDNA